MKKPVEDYLVPHEGNDNKPHIMRFASLLLLFLVVLIVFASSVFETSRIRGNGQYIAAVLPGVLVSLTNDDRADYGLTVLETSPLLERAAQLKANDMVERGYFDHVSPDGITPWVWFARVGYEFIHAGENLAINFTESADVVDAWMNSEGHRTNILDSNFTQTGIATAVGIYKGKEAIFVVQLFGAPAFAESASVSGAVIETPEENSILLSSTEIEENEDVQIAEAQGVVQSAESPSPEEPQSVPPEVEIVPEEVTASDSTEEPTVIAQITEEEVVLDEMPTEVVQTSEGRGQNELADQPSGFLQWFSLHPTLILQTVYGVIGGLVLFSLGLMVYRAAHLRHPRSVLAGSLLIILMIILSVVTYRYTLPMQFFAGL